MDNKVEVGKKHLPIGSIVQLKGIGKKVMICGYALQDAETKIQYNYMGCLYPIGVLSTKKFIPFDSEDIEEIYHCGFVDEVYEELMEFYAKINERIKNPCHIVLDRTKSRGGMSDKPAMDLKSLPIGSIVQIKNVKIKDVRNKIIICGYSPRELESKIWYDYIGCLYPIGFLPTKCHVLFNSEDIKKVYHYGYVDEEYGKFMEFLKEAIKKRDQQAGEIGKYVFHQGSDMNQAEAQSPEDALADEKENEMNQAEVQPRNNSSTDEGKGGWGGAILYILFRVFVWAVYAFLMSLLYSCES